MRFTILYSWTQSGSPEAVWSLTRRGFNVTCLGREVRGNITEVMNMPLVEAEKDSLWIERNPFKRQLKLLGYEWLKRPLN